MNTVNGAFPVVADWWRSLNARVGGSLFAVAPSLQILAARALVAADCTVHVDLILDEAGKHVGVSLDEFEAVMAEVPKAFADVHLMLGEGAGHGEAADREIVRLLARLQELQIAHLSVSRDMWRDHADAIARVRKAGIPVWLEIPPDDDGADIPALADGVLVMFIQPGTTGAADPTCLEKIPAITDHYVVGVDGGITSSLARACADAGASYIVSGRALLRQPTVHQKER